MTKAKIFKPKLIITDFDGCLTDDRVWLNEHGEEFVAANRKDGLGIKRVKKLGIEVIIRSTEENKVVSDTVHDFSVYSKKEPVMTLDSSGSLGIGTTPCKWKS